jgi:RHH-type transcriptional regulator, rel operon repressor / antitoxin RelB
MTTLIIELPEELRDQAERAAQEQGASVDELVRELLAEYLEELEDLAEARQIVARIESGEARTYSHAEVWARLEEAERRGELPD